MKVMTFNIRVDLPQDGENAWGHRVQAVTRMVQKHQPLIIGIQEGLRPMLEDLERDLSEYRWIGQGRRGGDEDEFCAIFYAHRELEPVDSGQFWLSEHPEVPNSISWNSDFPRICTWGRFCFKKEPSKTFTHFNTHLDHISQWAREQGARLIVKKMKEQCPLEGMPFLLTGDFNSNPDNPVIRQLRGESSLLEGKVHLKDAYSSFVGSPGKTFHGFLGGTEGEPIDFIFTSPSIKILNTEVDRSTVDGKYPSDHYPVICTLRWKV
ncbi:endonuclease/exonuclease/phosphatase family protein [Pseudalkalibacillus sp. Hm43]|uniref:endonuclease/exonuclease/phosphatase family protein n=1 Tax=Pseudalkalibacillus sp. Hm43 TaxID=3450742 RepID=UPI003F440D73